MDIDEKARAWFWSQVLDRGSPMTLGFGVTSTIDLSLVQRIAPEVEAGGFSIFWSNDIPGGSSFDVLAAAAGATSELRLANGVVPIDRVRPGEWKDRIDRVGLTADRFDAGIGSGQMKSPLEQMRAAVDVIRQETGCRIIVGALRAKMRRLAAERADGVLLNWLTPAAAADRRSELVSVRDDQGVREPFMTAAFVRVAIGDAAIGRLRHEAEKYQSFPSYRKHFDEMGVGAFETAVAATSVEDAADGLVPFFGALDHTVLRCVVASEDDDSYRQLIEAGKVALTRAGSV